VDVFV